MSTLYVHFSPRPISFANTKYPTQNVVLGNLDCTEYCAKAKRADGKANADGTAGTACNAPGATDIKYGCISAITAQGRTSCYVNNR